MAKITKHFNNSVHGGQLIHATEDDFGTIEVVEFQQSVRGLHFGNATQQSGMFLYNPNVLIHKYTQAMLTPICWYQPDTVLMLGLGAGSLAKYLLHFLPGIKIDGVDLRPEVIKVAQEYFYLPEEDENFALHYQLAQNYIDQNTHRNKYYDLILVDLFMTSNGKDITVDISECIEKLSKLMTDDACLCINIIGHEYLNYSSLEVLRKVFNYNIHVIPIEITNIILMVSHAGIPMNDSLIDFTTMEKRYGLPFCQNYNQIQQA